MTGKNTASVMFRYMARTLGNVRASSGSLLTCVLPHHVDAKQNAPVVLKVRSHPLLCGCACFLCHAEKVHTHTRCPDVTDP